MLNIKRIGWVVAAALPLVFGQSPAARALTRSDRPAAIVVFPLVQANSTSGLQVDTLIELSNVKHNNPAASPNTVTAHCFYVNANSHCTNTGAICSTSSACTGATFGTCVPGWAETDFNVTLTPEQPLSWSVLRGLSKFPLQGLRCTNDPSRACFSNGDCTGTPSGTCGLAGNSGSLVPPSPENPFIGELKCIEIDPSTGDPPVGSANTNDLKGEASLEQVLTNGTIDVAKYNAVGFTANGNNDGDSNLVLAMGSEYEGCSPVLIMDHLFDAAVDPINANNLATTDLTLVPCTEDFRTGNTSNGASTAQFLVFNEFEQRFSTSRRVECLFNSQLSLIDTTQPSRSIFSAVVSGTVAGQTRISGIGGGLIGVARLTMKNGTTSTQGSAAYNIHQDIGERANPDIISLP